MRCAVVQPSYIPWRGYFDMIGRSDVFVFYDDVQFDKHGWRNRNRIKTPNGSSWLTIPVRKKGNVEKQIPINEIEIANELPWSRKHLGSLRQSYSKAPHFERYFGLLERRLAEPPDSLSDLTIDLTVDIAGELGIGTKFVRSSDLDLPEGRLERLIATLEAVGASEYLSGPSAQDYIDDAVFERAGIALEYVSYDYPDYPQLHPPFDPQVSVVDLLFAAGTDAGKFIWGPTGEPPVPA